MKTHRLEAGQFIEFIDPQFVFPQFTSFHSVFHSFHGLMNSINWPASSVWVFIAQLVKHCSANAEAKPNPFFRLISQLLKVTRSK